MLFRVAVITGELIHVSDLDQAVMIGYDRDILQNLNSLNMVYEEHALRIFNWWTNTSVLKPGLPVLLEAVLAINRPAFRRLERYFTFLLTIGTGCFRHFSGARIPAATESLVIHFLLLVQNINPAIL